MYDDVTQTETGQQRSQAPCGWRTALVSTSLSPAALAGYSN